MARISTFELLSKRIGPPGGIFGNNDYDNLLNAPFRKLIQGYYLTIANFNRRDLRLRMRATFPRINTCGTVSPFTINDRELVNAAPPNHVYAYDITGDNQTAANPRIQLAPMFQRSISTNCRTYSTLTFPLCGCQTGLVNLLPSPPSSSLENPQIEVRGYIEVVMMVRYTIIGGIVQFLDSLAPVDLMFTPELRGTFLDDSFPVSCCSPEDYDFDQSIHCLPTATGAAVMTVPDIELSLVPIFLNPDIDDLVAFISLEGLAVRVDFTGRVVLEDKALERITQQIDSAEKELEITARPFRDIRIDIERELNLLYEPNPETPVK